MKTIKPEAEFTAEQLNKIAALAESTGLCEQTVAILYGRGIDSADAIEGFMNPSARRFLSPYLMSGMKEAVSLITRARDEGWSVIVYGDYDADGICASTILVRALADFGIEANVFVPERTQGYGLSREAIDGIFEEWFPQLFITVDCGISDAEEVEYIKELGAEVIITDHHELPSLLPDCICVNPKFSDDYPYDNLCGAGVAFKLGCALNGKQAYGYLDFAAIATVADSVPIVGENRDIVAEGLKLINARPRKNYGYFLNKNGETVTAQSLAFSIAPRVNAAGRMGNAGDALRLFLSDDEGEMYALSVKLGEYNLERQKYCDELYLSAKEKIKQKGADSRVIILSDESWNTGFVGIVAARLAEEYGRPAMLFVKNGEMLKGSARSVEGVNIFEALRSCADIIAEFGGHSQAAGINVSEENLPLLEERLNAYLHENYSSAAFTPTYYINGEQNGAPSRKFIAELEMLEPFGVGNRRPLFTADACALDARPVKSGSPHISIKTEQLEMTCFSGAKYLPLLRSALPKKLVFEYNVSTFRQRRYIRGIVRDVVYSQSDIARAAGYMSIGCVNAFLSPAVACEKKKIFLGEAAAALSNRREYGEIFIINDWKNAEKYNLTDIEVNVFAPCSGSLSSIVLVSPRADCDLSGFGRVVYLDDPGEITLKSLEGKTVEVCRDTDGLCAVRALDTEREKLLSFFKSVSLSGGDFSGESAEDFAAACKEPAQAYFALKVFEELGLIAFAGNKLVIYKGVKTSLNNSPLYNAVNALKSRI